MVDLQDECVSWINNPAANIKHNYGRPPGNLMKMFQNFLQEGDKAKDQVSKFNESQLDVEPIYKLLNSANTPAIGHNLDKK